MKAVVLTVLGLILSLGLCEVFQVKIRSTSTPQRRRFEVPRFGFCESADQRASNRRQRPYQRATGSQTLRHSSGYYAANISLGTPPQQFTNILLDTGSADLWVIDSRCNSSNCRGSDDFYYKNRFNGSASSTYTDLASSVSFQDQFGSIRGHLAVDTIKFGGLTFSTQTFIVADSITGLFVEESLDGVMGLAWPAISVAKAVPPLQNVLPQLDAPLFTIWLNQLNPQSSENAGVITYGAIDNVNCDANVHYAPLTAESYWQFAIDRFSFSFLNHVHITVLGLLPIPTWLDSRQYRPQEVTGWGHLSATLTALPLVWAHTTAKNGICTSFPCGVTTAPDLVFTINGQPFHISLSEYIVVLYSDKPLCGVSLYAVSGGGFGPTWILGETFSRSYCNVFDIANKRIGFAKAKH